MLPQIPSCDINTAIPKTSVKSFNLKSSWGLFYSNKHTKSLGRGEENPFLVKQPKSCFFSGSFTTFKTSFSWQNQTPLLCSSCAITKSAPDVESSGSVGNGIGEVSKLLSDLKRLYLKVNCLMANTDLNTQLWSSRIPYKGPFL